MLSLAASGLTKNVANSRSGRVFYYLYDVALAPLLQSTLECVVIETTSHEAERYTCSSDVNFIDIRTMIDS